MLRYNLNHCLAGICDFSGCYPGASLHNARQLLALCGSIKTIVPKGGTAMKAIVMGAGLTRLPCATELAEQGVEVILLEAQILMAAQPKWPKV